MSVVIIGEEKGFGFTLTRYAGPAIRGTSKCGVMYQITTGANLVQLESWQMLQLVSAFVLDHNSRIVAGYTR